MLTGKTAIITGSTSGIGAGIARALAEAGCHVVLNGFGAPGVIEELRTEIAGTFGVQVSYRSADMRKPAEIRQMVAEAYRVHGSVDILVNNAGIQFTSPIESFPDEKWDEILAVNLSASFHTIKSALPMMKSNGWGRIINIASAHGLVASREKSAYVASKHGLVGLTKAVALETANTGVTVNAICPGWVHTSLVQAQINAWAARTGVPIETATADLLREKQPLLNFTTPEQIGALVVYLCGDAAQTITGAAISVDGGWTSQ